MRVSSRSGRDIPPGGSDVLTVTLASTFNPGRVEKTIMVSTNDPARREVRLMCEGKVLAPFSGPVPFAQFAQIDAGAGPVSRTVKLQRGDGGPIHPQVVSDPQVGLTTAMREVTPGESYELDVTLDPLSFLGTVRLSVTVSTGIEQAPTEAIRMGGAITNPRVEIVPPHFNFTASPAGQAGEQTVKIVSRPIADVAPPEITSVECSDPNLPVRLEEASDYHQVILTLPVGYRSRAGAAIVTVHTNDPRLPKLEIPVNLMAAGQTTGRRTTRSPRTPIPAIPNSDQPQSGCGGH